MFSAIARIWKIKKGGAIMVEGQVFLKRTGRGGGGGGGGGGEAGVRAGTFLI